MEYVYAALLLHSVNKKITEENLQKLISAVGASFDEARAKALVSSLSGVNIDEVIKSVSAPTSAPVVAPTSVKAEAEAAKAPEKKKEEKKEEAIEGLGALFG
jgi:large subunit ribosomal protein L12